MPTYTYAGTYSPQQITNNEGAPLKNLKVSVFVSGTSTLATLYTGRTKGATVANPTETDTSGNLVFFADPGQYDITGNGATITVVLPMDPTEPHTGDVSGTTALTLQDTSNVADVVKDVALAKTNDLSDLATPASARANLGAAGQWGEGSLWVPDHWYPIYSAASETVVLENTREVFIPFIVQKQVTISALGVHVTAVATDASCTWAMFVYQDSGKGSPGKHLSGRNDTISAPGIAQDAFTVPLTLTPGVYWLGFVSIDGNKLTLAAYSANTFPVRLQGATPTPRPTQWYPSWIVNTTTTRDPNLTTANFTASVKLPALMFKVAP